MTKKEMLLEELSNQENEQIVLCYKNKHTNETTFEYVIVMAENFKKKKRYIEHNYTAELFHKSKKNVLIALFDKQKRETIQ